MSAPDHPRSSRRRYQGFVKDYHAQKLDQKLDVESGKQPQADIDKAPDGPKKKHLLSKGRQRQYVGAYLRWLKPHRYMIGLVFTLALIPPCAHTECERFTGTREKRSTATPASQSL